MVRLNYLIEGLLLGTLAFVASCVAVAFASRPSWLVALPPFVARSISGAIIGIAVAMLIYSPPGQRSGAHMNPAVTLTFLYLGKIGRRHALAYAAAQFMGATLGIGCALALFGAALRNPAVHYVSTVPGPRGTIAALFAEAIVSFGLMIVVLRTASSPRYAPLTGFVSGVIVAVCITLEAPFSGSSMNPARTFGSAVYAMDWKSYWVYVAGPITGMLLAAIQFRAAGGRVLCAKLVHGDPRSCVFDECEYRKSDRLGRRVLH
jgi:aquaporin Z